MTYCRYCGRFDCPIQILFFVLFVSRRDACMYLLLWAQISFHIELFVCLLLLLCTFFPFFRSLFLFLSSPIHLLYLDIYRIMLSDKKYGLSVNIMATRVMPSLLPQTVNPSLNLEQFTILLETLQEMLDHIDRQQRNKLKLDNLSIPSPERHRPLRHQFSTDNMHVPPFNIPNLRIDQRKTSSAEDMARKNSTGNICIVWFFELFNIQWLVWNVCTVQCAHMW